VADPFAVASAVLHGSVLGMNAIYTAPGGEPLSLRVIRSQGSEVEGSAILDKDVVAIQRADVQLPARGARLQLLGTVSIGGAAMADPVLRISGDPLLDEEGVAWSCAIALT